MWPIYWCSGFVSGKNPFVRSCDLKLDGLVKRPSIPQSGRVGVEPFEFTSNGGGGVALLRLVKRRGAIFYEVVKFGTVIIYLKGGCHYG